MDRQRTMHQERDGDMSARLNHLGQPVGFGLEGWEGAKRPERAVLDGKYCRLEPLDVARHSAELFSAFQEDRSGRIWTYLPVGPFKNRDDFEHWLAKASASDDPLFFAIVDRDSGAAAGIASYLRIEPAVGTIEVGFITYSPRLQKTRAATDAMFQLMAHAFDELGYRRYEWKCDVLNAASRKAADRLGFAYEGLFRQATIYKSRNRDTAWYSVIDSEWPSLRSAYEVWLSEDNFDESGQQRRSMTSLLEALRH